MSDVKRLLDEATPLPWEQILGQVYAGPDHATVTPMAVDDKIAYFGARWPMPGTEADAALIVHAVNRLPDYEAAVDALERVLNVGDALWEDHPPVWMSEADDARAALARLRGDR